MRETTNNFSAGILIAELQFRYQILKGIVLRHGEPTELEEMKTILTYGISLDASTSQNPVIR